MGGGVWKKIPLQWSLEKNSTVMNENSGVWKKNSTAMNENSGVWKNSCDRIY